MLRVKIELVPNGDEENIRPIAEVDITNDGTGTEFNGHYDVVMREFPFSSSELAGVFTTEAILRDVELDISTPMQLVLIALGLVVTPVKRTMSCFPGRPWGEVTRRG